MFSTNLFYLFSLAISLPFAATLPHPGNSELPSIIFVPGAFHRPIVYDKVVDLLKKENYTHLHAIFLPSTGTRLGREHDVLFVRNALDWELENNRKVLLVGNSYGGTVIGEAVKGYKSNKNVLGLLYFSGFIPYINDVVHPETRADIRQVSPSFFRFTDDGRVFSDGNSTLPPSVTFYNDLSPARAAYWTSKLQYSSFRALNATSTYIPYTGDFKCTYVIGQHDNSVPPAFAQSYIQQPGAQFRVRTLESDHIPMLSHPADAVRLIREAAGESV